MSADIDNDNGAEARKRDRRGAFKFLAVLWLIVIAEFLVIQWLGRAK